MDNILRISYKKKVKRLEGQYSIGVGHHVSFLSYV